MGFFGHARKALIYLKKMESCIYEVSNSSQTLRLGHLQAAILALPTVNRLFGYAVLTAQIGDLHARLSLLFKIEMICSSVNRLRFI